MLQGFSSHGFNSKFLVGDEDFIRRECLDFKSVDWRNKLRAKSKNWSCLFLSTTLNEEEAVDRGSSSSSTPLIFLFFGDVTGLCIHMGLRVGA